MAWGDLPTLVLTTSTDLPVPAGADVSFRSGPTAPTVAAFAGDVQGRVWVFGGGSVVTETLLGGVVDTLDITVMPEAIGEGVPLFTEPFAGPMRPVASTMYDNGAVRLVYDTSPAGLRA